MDPISRGILRVSVAFGVVFGIGGWFLFWQEGANSAAYATGMAVVFGLCMGVLMFICSQALRWLVRF